MQVIGLCRFSYPAEGGFQVEHDSLQQRMDYLYAPARMEERFRLFEAIALPGLRAQTDPDFTLLILIGDSLPQQYRARLTRLIADFPQARIVARPPLPHRAVCKAVLNAARTDINAPCLQFRHDDDDAVAISFIARLRQAARDCAGLVERSKQVCFDFNRGHIARASAQGIEAVENVTPYWGLALGMSVGGGETTGIMNFAHNRIVQFMPTVTMTDSPMFVRGHNEYNNSRQSSRTRKPQLTPLNDRDTALFREVYKIDTDNVRRVFSA